MYRIKMYRNGSLLRETENGRISRYRNIVVAAVRMGFFGFFSVAVV